MLGSYIFQNDKKNYVQNSLNFLKACAYCKETDLFMAIKDNLLEISDLDDRTMLYLTTLECHLLGNTDNLEEALKTFEDAKIYYSATERLALDESLLYHLTEYNLALDLEEKYSSPQNTENYFKIAKNIMILFERQGLQYTKLAASAAHQIHNIALKHGDESKAYYYYNKYESIITILELEN
jgi:hypothetical protein